MYPSTRSSLTAALLTAMLGFACNLSASNFLDDFSTDTSGNYTGTDTAGSGGSFTVSGGNLNVNSAPSNTHSVFYNTAVFDIGETLSVDFETSSAADVRLSVSTAATGPQSGSNNGVRLKRNRGDGTFQFQAYAGGNTNFHSSFNTAAGTALTLFLTRETANTFSAAYDTGSGLVQLNTSGGPEKQIFTVTGLNSGSLFIGVENYNNFTTIFDDLQIRTIDYPQITSFTASDTTLSETGLVTFTWSAEDAASVTLNGQDVTGQSPLELVVNQSGDYTLAVTGASGYTVSQTISITIGEFFRIAAVADPQYADADPRGAREPRESVSRLTNAVSFWNQRDLDWGVIVGDIIDWDDINYDVFPGSTNTVAPQDWSNTEAILGAWDQLNVPGYLVLGNHDYYVPHEDADGLKKPASVYRAFGFKDKAYYSFRHKGFKFIVLEGDNSHLNYAEGTPEYATAKDYFDNNVSGSAWWNAGILTPQLIWLMEELDTSILLNEPVVIMCHYPVHNPANTGHSLYNAAEVTGILDGYRNVVLWLNGHNHSGDYEQMDWRHHVNLKGMQEVGDRWYEIAFSPNQVLVYQAENTTTPVFDLDITRPIYPLARPTGFSVSESTGSAQLSWDAEPAGVTEVIVEARQVSTAGSWQALTTITSPSGGTYLDSVSNPVSDYKYRIRFQSGSDLSPYSQALGVGESAGVTYSEFSAGLSLEAQIPSEDADSDGKANVLEHFFGTEILQPDVAPDREPVISRTLSGELQLVFSHDAATLHKWEISMSPNLENWQAMLRDVDYLIESSENWSPPASSDNYTRVTLKLNEQSSRNLAIIDDQLFMRLEVTPAIN